MTRITTKHTLEEFGPKNEWHVEFEATWQVSEPERRTRDYPGHAGEAWLVNVRVIEIEGRYGQMSTIAYFISQIVLPAIEAEIADNPDRYHEAARNALALETASYS